MDKVSMVKTAEVTGVIACLVDSGYIKLASDEDFDTVCGIVAENISDKDWTFDEVVEKTAEVMDEVYQVYAENGLIKEDGVEKEASDADYTDEDVMAAIGELTLAKEAGDVSDDEHMSKMQKLKSLLSNNKGKIGAGVGLAALIGLAAKRGYLTGKASAGNDFKTPLQADLGKAKKYFKDNVRVNPASAGNNYKRSFSFGKVKDMPTNSSSGTLGNIRSNR